MSNVKTENELESRLNGSRESFIRDCEICGINWAIEQYRLDDLPVVAVIDWAQRQTETKLYSQRGVMHDPREPGQAWAEDLLTVILRRFDKYEKQIAERDEKIERLQQAMQYHNAHPLDRVQEKVSKIMRGDRVMLGERNVQ